MRICNVVAVSDVHSHLDLAWLATSLPDTEYEPERYHALVYRTSETHSSILVNSSGKVVIVGSRGPEEVEKALDEFVDTLKKLGVLVRRDNVEIVNVVVSFSIQRPLETAHLEKDLEGSYMPAKFPGLVYKPHDFKATFLIFRSGKVLALGLRSLESAAEARELLLQRIPGEAGGDVPRLQRKRG